ncbi:expressed unknown protein [Seminavis robusta]|uniref:Uncharacterized protein n=1 Tax=Seminavis robusta TaxID=568900 RepID=A0A9N8HN45_9STRA|nr:expressed unknown protein [Seminavis robusta]|eukprot:Sro794_g203420.1 n/a (318) ;mRNA; r:31433-32386
MPDLSAGSGGATRGSTSTSTQQQQQQQRNDDLQSAATSNGLATLLEEETVDHHSSSKYSSTAAGYKNSHSDNKIKKASLKKDDAAYSKSIDDLSSFSKASMISDRSKPSAKQQLQDFNNNSNDKSPASLEMPPSKRQPSLGYQPNPSFRSSGNSISLPGAHATAGIQSSDMVLPAQPIMLEQQSSVHTNGVSNETTTSEHNNNHDNNNHITVLSSNTRQNHNHSQAHPDPEMALRTNNNTYEPEARPVMEQNLPQATPFSTTGNNEAAEETKKDVCLRLSMMANLVMFIMIGIIVGVILSRRSKSSSDSSSNPDDGN